MNKSRYHLVSLVLKKYEGRTLTGFIVDVFSYNDSNYQCGVSRMVVNKQEMYNMINNNMIVPINSTIGHNRLMIIKFSDPLELVKKVLTTVRKYMEISYGTGTDLAGHCIEASEYIVKILSHFGFKDARTVEGYCLWEDEYYGSDRPYDEHTWVELKGGTYYADVTADQFNPGMSKSNEYSPIILRKGLPFGMVYEEPVEGEDYWV